MSGQLFAAIRRGKVKPGMAAEFAKRVKEGALPVMQKMDGFKGYYLVAGADDTIIAVSLFTNKAVADVNANVDAMDQGKSWTASRVTNGSHRRHGRIERMT